jgi:hypothetical protein
MEVTFVTVLTKQNSVTHYGGRNLYFNIYFNKHAVVPLSNRYRTKLHSGGIRLIV